MKGKLKIESTFSGATPKTLGLAGCLFTGFDKSVLPPFLFSTVFVKIPITWEPMVILEFTSASSFTLFLN